MTHATRIAASLPLEYHHLAVVMEALEYCQFYWLFSPISITNMYRIQSLPVNMHAIAALMEFMFSKLSIAYRSITIAVEQYAYGWYTLHSDTPYNLSSHTSLDKNRIGLKSR